MMLYGFPAGLMLQNGTLSKKEDVKENRKEEPNAESDTSEEVALAVAVEAEVEAEEEILPVMVAPGHIRFEPDEGNINFGSC
jgi:hypothetical protein